MFFGVWNIRGLVDPIKQAEIRSFVKSHNLLCLGIIETKVSASNFDDITWGLLPGWTWIANYQSSPRGRIWIGWKPQEIGLEVLSLYSQVIHCRVHLLALNLFCNFSVVYGEHTFVGRRPLWQNLISSSALFESEPWLVAGDFNAIRCNEDRMGSSNIWIPAFDEFGDCLVQSGLMDLKYVGHRFTWSTSAGDSRKLRKIDRVLINDEWANSFSFSEASFLDPGVSDHTPMLIRIAPPISSRKPFKFFNFWMTHPSFSEIVSQVWSSRVNGSPMFVLCCKLRMLKGRLKQLNRESFSELSARVTQSRAALYATQQALSSNPFNAGLATLEKEQVQLFSTLRLQEEAFFKQKSRIRWLQEGDRNTKYFHHFVKKRQMHNRILSVTCDDGNILSEPSLVSNHIVSHFQNLFSASPPITRPLLSEIRPFVERVLSEEQILFLARDITDVEIRNTMFSLAKGKAPGPDGFNVDFFTSSWDTVGPSVILAIKDFFREGSLLKEVNSTILTLVPKIPNASSMSDYRPIACCNTVYKCVTKILANRIASVLPSIIGPSQNAFVKGRRISDNILLAQELFAGFHHDPYLPKCAIKVDFRKAYDTIDWRFLELVLHTFRFPPMIIHLIMECVTSPKFSVALNGELHGFFASKRGIRQGDPLSPYLFTLVMEVFSGILHTQSRSPGFKFYWRCKPTSLTHLFFADDVLLFVEANVHAANLLKDGITLFSSWSGLIPNQNKSEIFISGGTTELHDRIRGIFGFNEGKLPFRYLGVPVTSSRLSKTDCSSLIDSITARAKSWSQRFLSFAGRLQLIKSVLHSIQVFWASVFTIPLSVLARIELILRQFLWKGPELGPGGAKVTWSMVCRPKKEGGLGLRRLSDCNKAAMLKHIWILFTDKESLWHKWIHSTFLKNKNFWVAPKPTFCSWAWKKILDLRKDYRRQFVWRIGDGSETSFWFDYWHPKGPFCELFSNRDIYCSGIPRFSSVQQFLSSDWRSSNFLQAYNSWSDPSPVLLDGRPDKLIWQGHSSGAFSTASAWELIRRKHPVVPWGNFIWDVYIEPRYGFFLWLLALDKLPTQSVLLSSHRISGALCAFCHLSPDSTDHLFFGCSITASLANFWATNCDLCWTNSTWQDNFKWVFTTLRGNSFRQRIARFSFGALCHIIWVERNHILFRNKDLYLPAMRAHLTKIVKDRGLSFKSVPDSPCNRRIQLKWGLSTSIFV